MVAKSQQAPLPQMADHQAVSGATRPAFDASYPRNLGLRGGLLDFATPGPGCGVIHSREDPQLNAGRACLARPRWQHSTADSSRISELFAN